jgi:hypothetical protein
MDKFGCSAAEQDDVVKTAVDRQGKVIKSVSLLVNNKVIREIRSQIYLPF